MTDNVELFPVSELVYDTTPVRLVRVHKRSKQAPFTKGPIPTTWVVACRNADINAIYVALEILRATHASIERPSPTWIAVTETFVGQLGLSRYLRNKAVDGLDKAGLAEVERVPNRAPRVRLRAWPLTR